MKIPRLVDLFESLQDRNRLTRALKARNMQAARQAIVGKRPSDFGLTDSDFRDLHDALGGAGDSGDINAARNIWGIPDNVYTKEPSLTGDDEFTKILHQIETEMKNQGWKYKVVGKSNSSNSSSVLLDFGTAHQDDIIADVSNALPGFHYDGFDGTADIPGENAEVRFIESGRAKEQVWIMIVPKSKEATKALEKVFPLNKTSP